jgi:enamine deaminase RidA (YjgF/YER057c/UK114 family)
MPHHQERTASALARGPAKTDDIESARRGTAEAHTPAEAHAQQAIAEIETACQTIRDDLDELKRTVRTDQP